MEEFLQLHFDKSVSEADRLAADLQEYIERRENITLRRIKGDSNAQNMGEILILTLGTPAVGAAIKALHDWLIKRNNVTLTIKTKKGEVVATGISSKDITVIMEGYTKL